MDVDEVIMGMETHMQEDTNHHLVATHSTLNGLAVHWDEGMATSSLPPTALLLTLLRIQPVHTQDHRRPWCSTIRRTPTIRRTLELTNNRQPTLRPILLTSNSITDFVS